jgi:hypothetical protein
MRIKPANRLVLALAIVGGIAGGCRDEGDDAAAHDDDDDSDADDGGDAAIVALDPVAQLVRVSMALRGKRPSRGDIAAVEADPDALEDIVDGYLDDPAFGATIRDLHNDALLVLADYLIYPAGFEPIGPLADADVYALNRAIMEAPLRLVEHVVVQDRPYTEIVTADYTVANGDVAAVWGLAHEGDADEWTQTSWEDGRGNAGILADSWLFQRHSSTPSNANRGRANAVSRALLCYDFLSRDIEVDAEIDLADPEAVANAVVENPACASCHQALDPLASFFRGYYPIYVPMDIETYPHYVWYPELFPDLLGVPMRDASFFGAPGDGVESLGTYIAGDPRFSLCTARRFYAYFHQVDLEAVPMDAEIELQHVLLESGYDAKALTKAIVLSDEFLVSHVEVSEDDELDPADDVVGVKKARPVQLDALFADLTGFRWTTDLTIFASAELPWGLGNVDLMNDSFLGYGVLAGGLDSIYVTRPSHTYSATVSLVLRTLAQLAADHVVESDFAVDADERKLLGLVEPGTSDEATVRAQLVDLHLRLFGERVEADDADVDDALALWSAALEHGGDPRRAWKVVLAALLQDARIAYY